MELPEATDDAEFPADFPVRRWPGFDSSHDVEAWIDHCNRDLQRALDNGQRRTLASDMRTRGSGICFMLEMGGEVYVHTTSEGELLVDVTPEAAWAVPAIMAATGVAAPAGAIWRLDADLLTQLVWGLSSLIAATRLVAEHDYGGGRRR